MVLDALRAIFATVALGIAAYGAGLWMERRLPASFSALDRLACSWLGGLGILGVALFLIGQIVFTPIVIAIFVLGLGAVAFFRIASRKDRPSWLTAWHGSELMAAPKLPAIVILFVLVI